NLVEAGQEVEFAPGVCAAPLFRQLDELELDAVGVAHVEQLRPDQGARVHVFGGLQLDDVRVDVHAAVPELAVGGVEVVHLETEVNHAHVAVAPGEGLGFWTVVLDEFEQHVVACEHERRSHRRVLDLHEGAEGRVVAGDVDAAPDDAENLLVTLHGPLQVAYTHSDVVHPRDLAHCCSYRLGPSRGLLRQPGIVRFDGLWVEDAEEATVDTRTTSTRWRLGAKWETCGP